MSIVSDIKYVKLIGNRLSNFTHKSDYLYNCRCPLCGDSKRNIKKARGFFYRKKGGMFYKCHNCGVGTTLANFIKQLDSELYKKYVMERWKSGDTGFANYKKPEFKFEKPSFRTTLKSKYIVPIITLDDDHVAVKYLMNGQLPKLNDFYFTEEWGVFIDDILPDKYPSLDKTQSRIIIPFYSREKELTHLQGRTIDNVDQDKRYITIKIVDDIPKVFGLDKIDFNKTVYVVEGPFDSLFLPNCIALGGGDCELLPDIVDPSKGVVVMDNEPRNIDTVKRMNRYIDMGYPICIWPEKLKEKDINDIFLSGMNSAKIVNLINKNTHTGMKAKFSLRTWQKC